MGDIFRKMSFGELRRDAIDHATTPYGEACVCELARRLEAAEAALRTIDSMPVDGVSPFVIESMFRQAKALAYARVSDAAREAKHE